VKGEKEEIRRKKKNIHAEDTVSNKYHVDTIGF
jgi:hypothetical protein